MGFRAFILTSSEPGSSQPCSPRLKKKGHLHILEKDQANLVKYGSIGVADSRASQGWK